MATTHQGIDLLIRKISAEQAIERTPQLWARLKSLPPEDALTQSEYIDVLRYTARRILAKIEEAGFNAETWKSYTDFFTQAIVAFGTVDMASYLRIIERLLTAVMGFPSGPQPLLREYLNCAVSQSTQRNAELAIYLAKNPTGEPPQLERQPDLEYDDNFVACIVAKPVSEAMKVLEKLPNQLTFAHRHAIMHLKLCNPLPIPGCAYVSTGYCCDTCHLRGIRVGFQAMLYDDEEGSTGVSPSVRSDAQISRKKTYGFDICMACALTFYAQQREHLFGLLRSPHKSYSFGHAAGVRIAQARYHARRRAVSSSSSSQAFPLSREHSGTASRCRPPLLSSTPTQDRRFSGQSATSCTSPAKMPSSGFDFHDASSNSSCGSSACSLNSADERSAVLQRPPPSRPPARRMSSGRGAPSPPLTRCATQDVPSVSLYATIAPYGARPIAWVLSRAEKFAHVNTVEEVLRKRIGPDAQWRSLVKIESAAAQRRRRASAASQAADGRFAAGVSASAGTNAALELWAAGPSRNACATPRELMETLSPTRGQAAMAAAMADAAAAVAAAANSDAEDDMCAICLCPFEGEEPVIETKCHHWFHVSCIEEYIRIAEDVCPLCRASHVLPDMTRATTLKHNAFKLEVELTEEQRQLPYVDICVASAVTRDGNFHNATSIAAAQCVRVYPNQLRVYQVESPTRKPEAVQAAKA